MFEKPLHKQQQWELVAGLAERFDNLSMIRQAAVDAERTVEIRRRQEAKVLQEIQDYRKRLGLPDVAIPDEGGQDAEGARYG